MKMLVPLLATLSMAVAHAQPTAKDDEFWRGVEITPERKKIVEDSMRFGALAGELGKRMNKVLGNPRAFGPVDRDLCLKLVTALDAYIVDPKQAPREDPAIKELYEVLDIFPHFYEKVDAMSVAEAKAQATADLKRDRKHFAERCGADGAK